MRFHYTFQKIVDLKTNEKTQAEWVLSEAMGRLRQEQSSLSELQQAKDKLSEELLRASESRTTISELKLMQGYLEHMDQCIHAKHQDVQKAQSQVQLKQEHLTDKMLEEKVWTKAKEQAFTRFTATMLKKEQEQMDEMATNRFRRLS
ncbi:flagellar export protein FliJ [Paenibacillus silviterrae]|uniref:flagellar export protein FliJ n=1 Tax=Paenibacillus silviterrae TaxID=3242194 RepID=UPI00254379B1|nr:flagellar export protein FliJ [Paenibacillus chinjuensis]